MGIPCTCIPFRLQIHNPITSAQSDHSPEEKQNESQQFDFKQHSQSVFNYFSQIRLKPKEHSTYINELLSKALPQVTNEPKETVEANDNFTYLCSKTSSFLISYLGNHEDMRSILKELSTRLELIEPRSITIEWDDKLYQAFVSSNKDDIDNQYSFLFSRLLNKNLRIVQYTIRGHYEPEIVPWLLILQNKEKTLDLLTDDYINYFVYSSSSVKRTDDNGEDISEFTTEFFFIYINPKDVVINGMNPMTGDYQPLPLNEDLFKNIPYKDDIISGSYIFIGKVLNVNFQLCNGDKREENLNISKNIL